ncbi:hypothetical protein [Nocardioides exalbidus]|uniref:hypothetical protein n=1 Tax=Nocardioides exalbidus TaxID=402596 RepID=UPI0011152554|nr:hypothetical protein [Nocardioides exalbidus]
MTIGLLVLLAAFAVGTEHRPAASVAGQVLDCGPSIPASWLLPGTPDRGETGPGATVDERRAADACGPVVAESRTWVATLMGLGCLVALVGGSAMAGTSQAGPGRVAATRS